MIGVVNMFQIIATGKREGSNITVICGEHKDELYFFFNNQEDDVLEKVIRSEMKQKHPVAGTYIPKEDEPINLKNVLEFYFFDKLKSIEISGDIGELPFEEGRIY